jgi:type II secretory pathway component HofQ
MSARSFHSLFMVASCAGAALGCYLVSLRVASERASLEDVETQIVVAQQDLRVVQTEIGTRGRLSQLERWNAGAFALSAPAADQILQGSFELAKLTQPIEHFDPQAAVVLASAPAPRKPTIPPSDNEVASAAPVQVAGASSALLHQASLKTETREVPAKVVAELPSAMMVKPAGRPVTAAKPALPQPAGKPGLAAAKSRSVAKPLKVAAALSAGRGITLPKKSVDKNVLAAAKPVTKPVELAKVDPLAPLASRHSGKPRVSFADR